MEPVQVDTVPALPGFWVKSSDQDWCERNYAVTYYVAEFWNTLTSLPIVMLGVIGLLIARRERYRKQFMISFILLALVGAGSVAFHGTLTKVGQALDELPMIAFVTSLTANAATDYPSRFVKYVPIALTVYNILFALAYFYMPGAFLFFVYVFVTMAVSLCLHGIERFRRLKAAQATLPYTHLIPTVNTIPRLLGTAVILVGGSFGLWIAENVYCSDALRPFNLHAVFHVGVGVGAYCGVIIQVYMHYVGRATDKARAAWEAATAAAKAAPAGAAAAEGGSPAPAEAAKRRKAAGSSLLPGSPVAGGSPVGSEPAALGTGIAAGSPEAAIVAALGGTAPARLVWLDHGSTLLDALVPHVALSIQDGEEALKARKE